MIPQTHAESTEGSNVRRWGNADVLLTLASWDLVGLKSRTTLSLSTRLFHKACLQPKVRVLLYAAEASRHTNRTNRVSLLTPFSPNREFLFFFFQVSSREVT